MQELSSAQLEELSRALTLGVTTSQHIDAGYTYLGQFVSHDIVPERKNGGRRVSPCLQLDSVYGPGPIDPVLTKEGLFPIGPSTPGGPDDLPRHGAIAQIPERRNDENVIIAQLHLFWQRLHNFVLRSGCADNAADARRLVTLTFQLIVVEDYLRQVLMPDVYCSYFHRGERLLNFDVATVPQIFSHGVFRFGHSMVRPRYRSLAKGEALLADIFCPNKTLDPGLVVDWRGFFGWPKYPFFQQGAMAIDIDISVDMRRAPQTVDVILANLEAGKDLKPGKAYAVEFGLEPLRDLGELGGRLKSGTITIDNLPVWPYVLLEALVAGRGKHLGVLGSVVCAEVFANVISNAQHSIHPKWPIPVDAVLDSMGAFGKRIQLVRRATAADMGGKRAFCMRQLVELVLDP